jgi:hypothetical protein
MIGSMARRPLMAALLASVLWTCSAPARATSCTTAPAYPGDTAPQAAMAAWMATGATAAGLPGELPVMGGLVESGLKNLNYGDADAVGFFGMRVSIWNNGPYAGFPTNPPLQLLWFTDQATAAGVQRTSMGIDLTDPLHWGDWVADVLQPPAQYRYRYQLQLDEARQLILAGCPPPPPPAPQPQPTPSPQPPTPPPADTVPPRLALSGSVRQSPHAGTLTVRAECADEACAIVASGVARIGGSKRRFALGRASASAPAGQAVVLRLRLPLPARRALRTGHTVRATITVTARDTAANATTRRQIVRVARRHS